MAAATVADYYVAQNTQTAAVLCGEAPTVTVDWGSNANNGGQYQLNLPAKVNVVVVTVDCKAQYSFGKILTLPLRDISVSAAVGIGTEDPVTKDLTDLSTNKPLIARLII